MFSPDAFLHCGMLTILPYLDDKSIARFWAKIDRNQTDDECWIWTSATWGGGYGQFWLGGQSRSAHRISWVLHNQSEVPDKLNVLHECDNPLCVNPAHLFLGTLDENNKDRARKGRSRDQRGQLHNMVKLTVEQVVEIRALRDKMSQRRIGERFGISQTTVSNIQRRERWNHVG